MEKKTRNSGRILNGCTSTLKRTESENEKASSARQDGEGPDKTPVDIALIRAAWFQKLKTGPGGGRTSLSTEKQKKKLK